MRKSEYCAGAELVEFFNDAVRLEDNHLLKTDWQGDPVAEFARHVSDGLSARPRRIDCRYLYDSRGSRLYEEITRQPEYYLTRAETAILADQSDELRKLTGHVNLVELGSGSSVKTNHLLRSYSSGMEKVCYVPVDVSESALLEASYNLADQHPEAQIIGVNSTYEDAFLLLEAASPTMVVFLGSTVGNLDEDESDSFWKEVSEKLPPGDFFLLGVDLVKEADVITAAYNDEAGITRAFTRNLFTRMNRELGAGVDPRLVEHEAIYESERQRVEIFARFECEQEVRVEPLGKKFRVSEGERIGTEISRKFEIEELVSYLDKFALETRRIMTDERNWFALLLLERLPNDGQNRNS